MSKGPSLLRSLAFDLLVIQAVAIGALFAIVLERLDATVEELEARDMQEAAMELAGRLSFGDQPKLALTPGDMARFSPSYGRYSFAILDNDGHLLFSSVEPPQALAGLDPVSSAPRGRFKLSSRHTLLWGVSAKAEVAGRPVWIQVAEDMNHRDVLMDEIVSGFKLRAGWLLVPLFFVQIGFALVRMQRRFRPLLAASESAASISPQAPEGRVAGKGVPEEILPLVEAVNSALARLEVAFRAQKEFLENAAHELKTPLAVLRARIETLDPGELRRELDMDVQTLSRLVTQLLRAAEMEGLSGEERSEVDLGNLVDAIAGYLRPTAAMGGKSITRAGDKSAMIHGCTETIGQAITNLVENALAHTAPGTSVDIMVEGGEHPEIRVRDHGPGVPEAERELVFQRFWRQDRRKGSGAGLGLSIVRRAMELHQGRVWVEAATGGGAVFILRF